MCCVQVSAVISDCTYPAIPSTATTETTAISTCGAALIALADSAGTLATKLSELTNIYNGLAYLETLQYDANHTIVSSASSLASGTPTMLALYNNLKL